MFTVEFVLSRHRTTAPLRLRLGRMAPLFSQFQYTHTFIGVFLLKTKCTKEKFTLLPLTPSSFGREIIKMKRIIIIRVHVR